MNTGSLNSGFGVNGDDIRAYDWQSTVAGATPRECHAYADDLANRATTLREAGDDKGNRVFRLLSTVASFWPNYDSGEAPYRPMMVWEGKRSAVPEDLSISDLDALAGILAEIRDAEFQARVGDVLWVCRKDYKAAQV